MTHISYIEHSLEMRGPRKRAPHIWQAVCNMLSARACPGVSVKTLIMPDRVRFDSDARCRELGLLLTGGPAAVRWHSC